MSNEELAKLIQDGDSDAVLQLWQQVEKFIEYEARQYSAITRGAYEVNDLKQEGFLAMLRAVKTYKPESGSFINYLAYWLIARFPRANGSRIRNDNQQRIDALDHAISIEKPLSGEKENLTIADLEPDPRDHFGEVERRIYLEQLQQQLIKAIDTLPEDQQQIIRLRYYAGLSQKQTGTELQTTASKVFQAERKALQTLRNRRELEQFIDDRTPFYGNVSVNQFMTTHESIVEKCVFKRERIRNEHETESANHS